jgi:hypothetical protein
LLFVDEGLPKGIFAALVDERKRVFVIEHVLIGDRKIHRSVEVREILPEKGVDWEELFAMLGGSCLHEHH